MNKPFNNWEKLNSTLSNHSQLKYHLDSVLAADTLRSTVLNPKQTIDVATNSIVQSQMTENTHILQQIVRGVIYLAKQVYLSVVMLKRLAHQTIQEIF